MPIFMEINTARYQRPQSFKALKPKAVKSLKSIKALSLRIQDKLGDSNADNTRFYYKVGWNLTEAQINNILERAMEARNPIRYFLSAASAEMRSGDV